MSVRLGMLQVIAAMSMALGGGGYSRETGMRAWTLLPSPAAAQEQPANTDPAAEQRAFDEAKATGSIEGWNAFLARFPGGFYAAVARAEIRKLNAPQTGSAQPDGAAQAELKPARPVPCGQVLSLQSGASSTAATLKFVNASDGVRVIFWIGFAGDRKEYARLAQGEELLQQTFLDHVWLVQTRLGHCVGVFVAGEGTTLARLDKPDPGSR